jgi:hypothetical protein
MTPRDHESNAGESSGQLLALARRLLVSLEEPTLAAFLADWPVSTDSDRATPFGATAPGAIIPSLPVLRWLPHIAADAHGFGSSLIGALCRAAPALAWHQTYTAAEAGATFLRNYGWTELFGPRGGARSMKIACGALLLGPHTFYPAHRHEAEEIYVPLSGTADWQQGDAVWRQCTPGTLVHHRSEEPHAMRTENEPLLALYVWRSANLSGRPRLDRQGDA